MNRPNVGATLQRVRGRIGSWLTGGPSYSTTVVTEICAAEAYEWLTQRYAPTWLAAAGLHDEARSAREIPPPGAEAVQVASAARGAAALYAKAAVLSSAFRNTATGVELETAAQQAIDATPAERMVAAMWADATQRTNPGWDVWEHLAEASYAAATAVAVQAAAADPANAEQAAKAALAVVVTKLHRSAGPLLGLLASQEVRS